MTMITSNVLVEFIYEIRNFVYELQNGCGFLNSISSSIIDRQQAEGLPRNSHFLGLMNMREIIKVLTKFFEVDDNNTKLIIRKLEEIKRQDLLTKDTQFSLDKTAVIIIIAKL